MAFLRKIIELRHRGLGLDCMGHLFLAKFPFLVFLCEYLGAFWRQDNLVGRTRTSGDPKLPALPESVRKTFLSRVNKASMTQAERAALFESNKRKSEGDDGTLQNETPTRAPKRVAIGEDLPKRPKRAAEVVTLSDDDSASSAGPSTTLVIDVSPRLS